MARSGGGTQHRIGNDAKHVANTQRPQIQIIFNAPGDLTGGRKDPQSGALTFASTSTCF